MSISDLNASLTRHYPNSVLVFGQGPVPCKVMLVGEAPGKHEIENNMPFCGQAGQTLNQFLKRAQLERSEIYITNVCKFRPTRQGISGRLTNRTPTAHELKEATPFLLDEILCVRPRIIVTLGNTPLKTLTGNRALCVGDVHGSCVKSLRPGLSNICILLSIILPACSTIVTCITGIYKIWKNYGK